MKRRTLFLVLTLALLALGVAILAGGRLLAGTPAPNGGPPDLRQAAAGLVVNLLAGELAAPGGDPTPLAFEVAPGEGFSRVAERLQAVGLIKNASALRLLARARNLDTGVQAGAYTLRRDMSAEDLLRALQRAADANVVRVTLPEGWRAEQIAARLAASGVVTASELMALVITGLSDLPLLAARPAGASLEGYLFPDTYEFRPNAAAADVLRQMTANFEARFGPALRAKAASSGLSLHEVVTLASIVERETPLAGERPRVARVYLNRLATPPYRLEADPTVQYGLGFQAESGQWWKRPLSYDDLRSDSPYNTYVHAQLPPGPIANPGLASLTAVVEPEAGDWQFFVANDAACDGSHVFALTFDEHLANVARYQNTTCRSGDGEP